MSGSGPDMTPRENAPYVPWADATESGRVAPRECIANARDALNRAYSHPGITDGGHALPFIAEALDWQRRALEQMVVDDELRPR